MPTVVNGTTSNVSAAANQTAQKAAETSMLQDPIFLGTIGVAIGLGLIVLLAKKFAPDKQEPLFNAKPLKERLNKKITKPATEFGKTTDKKVDYGLQEIGQLEKYYKTTEVTEDSILSDIHDQDEKAKKEIDDEVLDNDEYKNLTLVVGPTSFKERIGMKLRSSNPVSNKYLSVYSVPKSSVNNGERIVIDDEKVDWNYSGGIYFSKDVQGATTMLTYSALSLIDDLTEVFADKGDITQALNEKLVNWKRKEEVKNEAFKEYEKMKRNLDSEEATD